MPAERGPAGPAASLDHVDPAKQAAFIKQYENLPNQMGDDEVVLFGDAVHPVHGAQAVGYWAEVLRVAAA